MLDCEFLFDSPEELPNVLFPPETVCCIHIALQTFVHLPIIHVIRWGSRVPIAIIYHMLRCILQFIICLHFCEGLILQCTIITMILSSMVAALSSNCIRRWSMMISLVFNFRFDDLKPCLYGGHYCLEHLGGGGWPSLSCTETDCGVCVHCAWTMPRYVIWVVGWPVPVLLCWLWA